MKAILITISLLLVNGVAVSDDKVVAKNPIACTKTVACINHPHTCKHHNGHRGVHHNRHGYGHGYGGWGNRWGGGYGHHGAYRHASTAAEGLYTGVGRYIQSRGIYLSHLGRFFIDRETARSMKIMNDATRIRVRWEIQDEYKERNRSTYLEDRARALQNALQRQALDAFEKDLRATGALPPKTSYFAWNGVRYESWKAFKQTDAYVDFLIERGHN